MKVRSTVLILLFLCTSPLWAQEMLPAGIGNSFLPEQGAANSKEEEAYRNGTELLNDGQWQQAADAFSTVASLKGRRADAALYWQAYALNKAGKHSEANAVLAQLNQQYPKSQWLKDAGALQVEMKQQSGQPVNPAAQSDEDLKLLALNSLMNSDSERAIPMLQGVLSSPNNSPKLKDRALFVLAQSDSPKAAEVIGNIAKGQSGPDLQIKAIRYLGISGQRYSSLLQDIYSSANDNRVKKAVLNAYMTSGDKAPVLAAAKGEKDPDLRRAAIRQLGAMGAKSELMEMYKSASSPDDQSEIIQSLGIAGDTDGIDQIARTTTDPKVRAKAIRSLGIFGGSASRSKLVQIYNGSNDADAKKAAVEALFINSDAADLVALARKETDPQMRRNLVEKLSIMNNKEARDYMMEILNK